MSHTILTTKDKSHTVYSEHFDAHYHSLFGAIEESVHVFISAGLYHKRKSTRSPLRIFEMGLGTGLNVLLTYLEAKDLNLSIVYHAIESHPLSNSQAAELNFPKSLNRPHLQAVLSTIHNSTWNSEVSLSDSFSLLKSKANIHNFEEWQEYDLIYYDAFAPSCQHELWEEEIHSKLYNHLSVGGCLVTYCSQGAFRRTLSSLGYKVERLNGPAKKREMIRATKI